MDKVVLYKTATCPKCKVLAIKLEKARIAYEPVIVTPEIIEAKGIKQAPTLEVNGEFMDMDTANKWINSQTRKEN